MDDKVSALSNLTAQVVMQTTVIHNDYYSL